MNRQTSPFAFQFGIAVLILSAAPACAATTPRPAYDDPLNPPQGLFGDEWMVIMLNQQKMGYVHSQRRREGDLIHTDTRTYLKIQRSGMPVEVSMEAGSTETIQGEPRGFTSKDTFAQVPIQRRGTIRDGVVTITTSQFGQEMEHKVNYPAGALMEWGMQIESLRHEPTPGTVLNLEAYVPSQSPDKGVPLTIEVQGREDIDVLGRSRSAIRTRSITTLNGVKIESIGWIDDEWTPIKQELMLLGMKFEMLSCDKAFAMKDLNGAELFINTLLPIGRSIDRARAQAVTYRISARSGDGAPAIPETGMQKVIERGRDSITLQVTRQSLPPPAQGGTAIPPEFSEYLEPSIFITSRDPAVEGLARAAAGNEKDPLKLAGRLVHKVADEIKYKDLGTAFASAAEVCRRREGDCTEHGLLLAALGRAVGIPARVVTGLIYVEHIGGRSNVMGFHMWTQFWINGQWVDVDAAWDQTTADPTHIALGTHSMQHASVGDMVSAVMLKMQEFQIEVIDVQEKP